LLLKDGKLPGGELFHIVALGDLGLVTEPADALGVVGLDEGDELLVEVRSSELRERRGLLLHHLWELLRDLHAGLLCDLP
jgi:hypothetical protein